jgi:dihydroorotase
VAPAADRDAPFDLVLRDVSVPALGRLDVAIAGERIAATGKGLARGRSELDARGALLLPGFIDGHVHYREPGAAWKEGWVAGSSASLRGGATTVGEIQNNAPLVTNAAQWRAKVASLAGRARTRALVYGCALKSNLAELRELARAAPAVKLFLAGDAELEVSDEPTLRQIFEEVAAAGGLLLLHAEMGPLVREGLARFGERAADFSKARSVEAEREAVERCVELCAATRARVHFFHVSSAAACSSIRAAKKRGLPVSAAACAHYLLFTDEDVARRGALLKCNPSIKSAADRDALRAAVADGTLDLIESDHAPHPRSEKEKVFREAPSGIPGADLFASLWLELVDRNVLTLDQLVERGSLAPARLHRLRDRGQVAVGALADLVLVEESLDGKGFVVSERDFASKAKLSPYVGMALRRRASKVWIGGRLAFDRATPEDVAAIESAAPPPLGEPARTGTRVTGTEPPTGPGGGGGTPGGCC